MTRWSKRTIAPVVLVGAAGLVATGAVACRRRAAAPAGPLDPPDSALSEAMMEPLATGEGMPEPPDPAD